ncbi:MAG: BtpA/SgcQ family protein [candidate division NC10 bacterium]|nr:BtpA/SgcQ family protein [candidate division NC10 bacterium]
MGLMNIFPGETALVGMVHLLPLTGSPRYAGSLEAVIERAVADAKALADGGMDGCLVENSGDVPFAAGPVGPETVAAMTAAVAEVRRAVKTPDPRAALAIAHTTGASFVRITVHAGVVVTGQGIIQGDASGTLRYRRSIGAEGVALWVDFLTKHGAPLTPVDPVQEAKDLVHRELADVLVVSGKGTGEAADLELLKTVRKAVPDTPLFVGSGATLETIRTLFEIADGAIVGTAIKKDGKLSNPIDPARVERLVRAAR